MSIFVLFAICYNNKLRYFFSRCGIYIPHADATWEMPENSGFYRLFCHWCWGLDTRCLPRFEDMLHLYRNCDAVECKSTKGRDYSKPGTDLELVELSLLYELTVSQRIFAGKMPDLWPVRGAYSVRKAKHEGESVHLLFLQTA